ncbi:MAG: hypothetical protein IJJ14_07325, partial [Coriobacteriales bacterium]|nr:hypothetical protein [Coriobacteriales bacterium]
MRDHSKHIMLSREDAIQALLDHCDFTPGNEVVPVQQAIGRVLAQEVRAKVAMPNSLSCRLDSIAVHWDDFKDLPQGMLPDTSAWERGRDWQFSNTGVGMPQGFDTAIAIEYVEVSADERNVRLLQGPTKRFEGTRPAGADFPQDALLASRGALITPLLASHIASGGITHVSVVCEPKVAFLPTGNELVPVGQELPLGKNIETNSILIAAKIGQWGGKAVLFPVTPDAPDAIRASLERALEQADIVVLNAGSSKGSDDWSL